MPAQGREGRPKGALWALPDFRRLWAAQTVSVFGDQVSALALPLVAVLVLDASAAQMGLLAAARWFPHLLFSLAGGLVVDSARRRKPMVVAADIARAAALLTVPLAYWADALTIEHLFAVAFVVGTFTVLFDVAMSGYFPRVVPRAHIMEAQGHFGATRSLSYIAGPSVSGFLVQLLSAPAAVFADAVSFLVSGAFIARIRAAEPPPEAREPETIRARLASGFRFTLGPPDPSRGDRMHQCRQLLQHRLRRDRRSLPGARVGAGGRADRRHLRRRRGRGTARIADRRARRQADRDRAGDRRRVAPVPALAPRVSVRRRPEAARRRVAHPRRVRSRGWA